MNAHSFVLVSLVLASLVTGCMTRQSNLPEVANEIPPRWSAETTNEEANATPWARSMGDSALEELIEEAWANNPDLSAASRRVDMAREEAVIAGADRLPQAGLGLSGSQTKRNMIGFNFPGASKSFTSKSYGLNLNVSWELDLWGRLRDGRQAAKVEWQASTEDYHATRLSLAGQVAKSWYSAIEANRQLALAEETEQTSPTPLTTTSLKPASLHLRRS